MKLRTFVLLAGLATAFEAAVIVIGRRTIASDEGLIYLTIFVIGASGLLLYGLFQRTAQSQGTGGAGGASSDALRGLGFGSLLGAGCIAAFSILGDADVSFGALNWHALWKFAVLALVPAVVEEIIFRGVILSVLMRLPPKNENVVNLMQASAFSIFHASAPQFEIPLYWLQVLISGLILGSMTISTRALWMAMAFHFAWNFSNHLLFGVNKRLIAPLHGLHSGYPDMLLFVHITLGGLISLAALLFLSSRRSDSPYAQAQ